MSDLDKINKTLVTIFAAAVMLAGVFYFDLLEWGDNRGSYEYIRKAKKYIEEEKYKKALLLLHQAYEEAPEADNVRDYLLYGYLKYSDALSKAGERDEAIKYLSMALEMDGTSKTILNNLALEYCKKALHLASSGEYGPAGEALDKATKLAVKNSRARLNISNFLFNSSVEAFNQNKDKTFLLCLTSSYLLKPRFDTLVLMGEYYYKKADMESAVFYWEKAKMMKPKDAMIQEKIDKAMGEMAITEKMKVVETKYFNVQFYREYDINAEILKRTLADIYVRVGKDLDFYPSDSTPIILYNEEDFVKIFNKSVSVRGFYDGSIRIAFNVPPEDPMFQSLIAHEYTHAVVSLLTDNRCPVWLHEGIAVYEETRYNERGVAEVKAFLKNGGVILLAATDAGFGSADRAVLLLSYQSAFLAASFITDKWGWQGMNNLLKRIKNGAHYANAIDEEFYISVQVFERMLNEYAKEKIFGEN